jgi:hypothetical protein
MRGTRTHGLRNRNDVRGQDTSSGNGGDLESTVQDMGLVLHTEYAYYSIPRPTFIFILAHNKTLN